MNTKLTFSFIGGDRRQINVIKGFLSDGYDVNVYGINKEELILCSGAEIKSNLSEAVENADVIVLPLPYSSVLDSKKINAPLSNDDISIGELFRILSDANRRLVLAGKVDDRLKTISEIYGIKVIDYMEREELAVLNAIPTAEGAVKIAMEELPITIHSSECLCLGYGRVGKILARTLYSLGANVCVAVRKHRDLAYIKAYGYEGVMISKAIENLGKYDVVFNTVPSMIVDSTWLREVRDDCLIIDLASKPGGVDFAAAEKLGKKVIWALSLPGKAAPLTAGMIIKDTISNILSEQGVI